MCALSSHTGLSLSKCFEKDVVAFVPPFSDWFVWDRLRCLQSVFALRESLWVHWDSSTIEIIVDDIARMERTSLCINFLSRGVVQQLK